jgi:hypothetical protein
MAIATAEVVLGTVRFLQRLARLFGSKPNVRRPATLLRRAVNPLIALAVVGLFFTVYLDPTLPILVEGRSCGGVIGRKRCHTGGDRVFFARQVHAMTSRTTGVALGAGMLGRIQMNTILDRVTKPMKRLKPMTKPHRRLPDGWVFIGHVKRSPREPLRRLVACFPYLQYGKYFVVDFRRSGQQIRIYKLKRLPADWRWRFFVSAKAPRLEAVRDRAAEKKMQARIPSCREVKNGTKHRRRVLLRRSGRGAAESPAP